MYDLVSRTPYLILVAIASFTDEQARLFSEATSGRIFLVRAVLRRAGIDRTNKEIAEGLQELVEMVS